MEFTHIVVAHFPSHTEAEKVVLYQINWAMMQIQLE